MYEDLIKALRETDYSDGCPCGAEPLCKNKDCIILQAADAIEKLVKKVQAAEVAPITKSRIVINNGRNVCFACCGEVSRDFKYCPWCGAKYEVSNK